MQATPYEYKAFSLRSTGEILNQGCIESYSYPDDFLPGIKWLQGIKDAAKMPNRVVAVQGSDTRDDHSSHAAGHQKITSLLMHICGNKCLDFFKRIRIGRQ